MQCSKCNNSINEGQEVCLKCGHILGYESEVSKNCLHCAREIPIEYKKCPFCHKKQKYKRRYITLIVIIITLIINTYTLFIIYSPSNITKKEEYIENCIEISYEDLIRKNEHYDEAKIKLTGNIIKIENISNLMKKIELQIYVEDNKDYIIEGTYYNKDLIGFIKGDKITIYGKYKRIEGNTPIIKIEYIDMD